MSGVDVLAVLRRGSSLLSRLYDYADRRARKRWCPDAEEIVEEVGAYPDMGGALAAVAELVAADLEYDEARRLASISYGTADEDRPAQRQLREAIIRRAVALAAFGGSDEN